MFSFPAQDAAAERPLEMECGLVVVGLAIPHLNLLLEGFEELLAGKSCPVSAEIIRIGSRDYQGTLQPFMGKVAAADTGNLVVLSSKGLMEGQPWGYSTVHIRLLSALRLVGHGHILGSFDFSSFARSLLRRVSSLAYYYGACESDVNFKELSAQADAVVCMDDHFLVDAGHSRKMSGLIGYGSFCGDFGGLMPFLVAGLYVHAGKGASFGLGMYEVLPESPGSLG